MVHTLVGSDFCLGPLLFTVAQPRVQRAECDGDTREIQILLRNFIFLTAANFSGFGEALGAVTTGRLFVAFLSSLAVTPVLSRGGGPGGGPRSLLAHALAHRNLSGCLPALNRWEAAQRRRTRLSPPLFRPTSAPSSASSSSESCAVPSTSSSPADTMLPFSLADVTNALDEVSRWPPATLTASELLHCCHLTSTVTRQWVTAMRFLDVMIDRGLAPAPASVAELLRENNIETVVRWSYRRGAPLHAVAGLRVLLRGREHEPSVTVGGEEGGAAPPWAAALRFASIMDRLQTARSGGGESYTLGVVVPFLAAGGHWSKAVTAMTHAAMRGTLLDPQLVVHLVDSTAEPRTWATCLALLCHMTRFGVMQNAMDAAGVATFAKAAAVCPTWCQALGVFLLCRDLGRFYGPRLRPDRSLLGSVMLRCYDSGKWEVAARLHYLALKEGYDGCIAGEAFESLIASSRDAANWSLALSALSWMQHAGHAASIPGYMTLMELCADKGRWRDALTIGSRVLVGDADPVSGEGSRARPRAAPASWVVTQVYTTALKALSASDRIVFRAALAPTTSSSTALALPPRVTNWALHLTVLAAMVADGHVQRIPSSACLRVMEAVCRGTAEHHDGWCVAAQLLSALTQQEPRLVVPPAAYRMAATSASHHRQWCTALSLLRQLHHRDPAAYGSDEARYEVQLALQIRDR